MTYYFFAQDVPKAIVKIKEAIDKNIISHEYVLMKDVERYLWQNSGLA